MRTPFKLSILAFLLVSSAFAQDIDQILQESLHVHNFTYAKGEALWAEHIPTEITSTFEELINKNVFIKRLVCMGDSTDFEKNPFHRIDPICMQGHGAKMVVPLGYPTWSYEVILTPSIGGFFQQRHMTGGIPSYFYNSSSNADSKYFLLPLEDYEIPTYSIEESQAFIPFWKDLFVSENKMQEEYFDSHIRVIGGYGCDINRDSTQCRYFYVVYYFYVGWTKIRLHDAFMISYEDLRLIDMFDTLKSEKSFNFFEEKLPEDFMKYVRKKITILKLVDSVVSEDQIDETVTNASPLLNFDVNKDLKLNSLGELILELWGTVDDRANKCIHAEIKLEDGKISPVSECACYIY